MLFPTVVSVWNSIKPGKRVGVAYGDIYLLNPNRIIDMTVHQTDHSKFKYADDPDDPRDKHGYIECNTSVALVEAYYNINTTHKFATLNVFPHLNQTGTPVSTSIEWNDIAYIWATPRDTEDNVCRLVYYRNDWKRTEVMVNMSLLAILMLQVT